jgi:hypothetical protein
VLLPGIDPHIKRNSYGKIADPAVLHCCSHVRHLRKRFLSRISHIAILELNRPDIVYNIVGAMNAYKIR